MPVIYKSIHNEQAKGDSGKGKTPRDIMRKKTTAKRKPSSCE